jgi:sugar/nucleoside kinase (ribokinase family)
MQAAIVHFCPLTADELHPMCIQTAKMHGALVSLDIQGFLRESRVGPVRHRRWTDNSDVLRYIDVLKADDTEIMMASDATTELAAVTEVMDNGPRIVAVTREGRGSTVYTRNTQVDIPAVLPSKLVDSTGCGDTYIIGFMLEYVRCGDVKRAGLFAATCASFNLESVGPVEMPSRDQVEARMRKYM